MKSGRINKYKKHRYSEDLKRTVKLIASDLQEESMELN
jgi:hypothetical protein